MIVATVLIGLVLLTILWAYCCVRINYRESRREEKKYGFNFGRKSK